MRLNKGDKIVCIVSDIGDLTYGKLYEVTNTRGLYKRPWTFEMEDDICITDDMGFNWWFGQIGESECWDMWFVTEQQWNRQQKLDKLI